MPYTLTPEAITKFLTSSTFKNSSAKTFNPSAQKEKFSQEQYEDMLEKAMSELDVGAFAQYIRIPSNLRKILSIAPNVSYLNDNLSAPEILEILLDWGVIDYYESSNDLKEIWKPINKMSLFRSALLKKVDKQWLQERILSLNDLSLFKDIFLSSFELEDHLDNDFVADLIKNSEEFFSFIKSNYTWVQKFKTATLQKLFPNAETIFTIMNPRNKSAMHGDWYDMHANNLILSGLGFIYIKQHLTVEIASKNPDKFLALFSFQVHLSVRDQLMDDLGSDFFSQLDFCFSDFTKLLSNLGTHQGYWEENETATMIAMKKKAIDYFGIDKLAKYTLVEITTILKSYPQQEKLTLVISLLNKFPKILTAPENRKNVMPLIRDLPLPDKSELKNSQLLGLHNIEIKEWVNFIENGSDLALTLCFCPIDTRKELFFKFIKLKPITEIAKNGIEIDSIANTITEDKELRKDFFDKLKREIKSDIIIAKYSQCTGLWVRSSNTAYMKSFVSAPFGWFNSHNDSEDPKYLDLTQKGPK